MNMHKDGFHRLAYTEWGDPANREIVVCAHGLTLNSRYFDWFAKACEDHYRVICPDVVGRGKSDWVEFQHYWYDQYIPDAAALLARVAGTDKVNWVGTSMGGLIGIEIASKKDHPIKRLVLNDVGPFVPKEGLQGIANYIGKDERFKNHDEVEAHLRKLYPKFGDLTDVQWRHLARVGSLLTEDGDLRLAYDPDIRLNFAKVTGDFEVWDLWEKIDIPVLILRGSESGILTQETLDEMLRRNPNASCHVFEGIGHAPPLMAGDQIDIVLDFLAQG
ncbi:MAG: alpha/beta hydrolase [Burkholderiales bacterium]|nr:alpha/beta hydrolase [Burkholderiales bacterium]